MSHYIFGPVRSRRLGRSLGVDLVPHKTCSFDCTYCELGGTTVRTIEIREWVPLEGVLEELGSRLSGDLDFITLGGSGEPILYSRMGELILGIKKMTAVPVTVLTNGSLLWMDEVRERLLSADLIIPSLDAGDAAVFQRINRPHPSVTFDRLVRGLKALREEFTGEYLLEVFIQSGLNDTREEVEKIARLAREIRPDRVQLNTLDRPPAEPEVEGVSAERLAALAGLFHLPVEIVQGYSDVYRHLF